MVRLRGVALRLREIGEKQLQEVDMWIGAASLVLFGTSGIGRDIR